MPAAGLAFAKACGRHCRVARIGFTQQLKRFTETPEALWSRPERSEWFGGGFDVPGIHSIMARRA